MMRVGMGARGGVGWAWLRKLLGKSRGAEEPISDIQEGRSMEGTFAGAASCPVGCVTLSDSR